MQLLAKVNLQHVAINTAQTIYIWCTAFRIYALSHSQGHSTLWPHCKSELIRYEFNTRRTSRTIHSSMTKPPALTEVTTFDFTLKGNWIHVVQCSFYEWYRPHGAMEAKERNTRYEWASSLHYAYYYMAHMWVSSADDWLHLAGKQRRPYHCTRHFHTIRTW